MKKFLFLFLIIRLLGDTRIINYGQLTNGIVTNNVTYNKFWKGQSFDTIASLIAAPTTTLPANSFAYVRGYYNTGTELGGGLFSFMSSGSVPSDITSTNYGTCFAPADNSSYRWVRVDRTKLTPYDFGAVLDGSTDDTFSIQSAFANTKELTFPAGTTAVLAGIFSLPDGITLHVNGNISGAYKLNAVNTLIIDGKGAMSSTYPLAPAIITLYGTGGIANISGVKITGNSTKYGILIDKDAQLSSLRISGTHLENLKYGILREAYYTNVVFTNKYVANAYLGENYMTNLYAAGIDWEPILADAPPVIKANVIKDVKFQFNGSNGFGGFAIGVAGWNYDTFYNTLQFRKLSVIDNVIDKAPEGIHLEYLTDAAVTGNSMTDIISSQYTYTTNTLPKIQAVNGIVAYAVKHLNASGNTVNGMSYPGGLAFGASVTLGSGGGYFTSSPDEVSILNNHFDGGGISLNILNTNSVVYPDNYFPAYATINGNTVYNGQNYIYGRGQIIYHNNYTRANWGGIALTVRPINSYAPYLVGDYLNFFSFVNNTAVNPIGGDSFVLDTDTFTKTKDYANLKFYGYGNNFYINSASQLKSVNHIYTINAVNGPSAFANSIPYGVEFIQGDVLIDITQAPPVTIYVTGSGSVNRPLDFTTAIPSTNYPYGRVAAAAGNWLGVGYANHTAGQRVKFGGSGLTGMIKNVYYDSTLGVDMMIVVDEATGLPLDFTGAYPSDVQAKTTATFSGVSNAGILVSVTITAGSFSTHTITLAGASTSTSFPQGVEVSLGAGIPAGIFATAAITGANTITVTLWNSTAGNLTISSGAVFVQLKKFTTNP